MATFFAELRRRNVLRAGALYIASAWALAQGVAQLLPVFGAPDWVTRWIVIAEVIGFPFWLAFAWFYELTPTGLKRESEIVPDESIAHSTARKLDFWIIGVLCVAVVLLLTAIFVPHRNNAAAIATIPESSIAVLPFANEGGDKDQQYFSDGLSEDFITALSQFAGLKVIGRNSAFQFRASKDSVQTIGSKLGVAHLLEGSVRRQGDEVRISAELINARDGSTLWSEHYDRPYTDLFKLQDEITHAVASALQAKLLESGDAVAQSDRPPSGNLDAYSAYLQGKSFLMLWNAQAFRQAIVQFNTATQLDPNYAAAYAGLSYAWTALATRVESEAARQAFMKSRAAVDKALRLQPDSAAAHGARGYLLMDSDFDWMGMNAELQRALQLAPNDALARFQYGNAQAILGHPARAAALTQQALSSDPLNTLLYLMQSYYQAALGHLDEARKTLGKALQLQPDNVEYLLKMVSYETQAGNAKAAMEAAKKVPAAYRSGALAMARQIGGGRAAADAALASAMKIKSPYFMAELYGIRKEPDKMFASLDRAWANHGIELQYLLYDPFIVRYKDDPRFAAFCKKIGLPTTTTTKPMP